MVSLFQAFAYCQNFTLCKAEFEASDGWLMPDSAYNDTSDATRPDGTERDFPVDVLIITPSEHDSEVEFEEQHVEINNHGIGIVKDTAGNKWAFRFRMYVPVTEQEVREHQVRQLISR